MGISLFNEKTIKELTKDIKINAKQNKLAKKWLELLEEGKLTDEKKGYTPFQTILLNGLLGYSLEIEDFEHEKDYADFTYLRDRKDYLKIEVKGTKTKDLFKKQIYRNNPESPADQIWRYISDSTPYGIVTNYRKFILFKFSEGNKTYYEFDFFSIKNNEEKLKEFLGIFSKTSIDNNFIVKLREKSEIQDRIITDDLYKVYHETRLMMIKEFQENGVSKEEAIHFAQLYLDRLMFIVFAEDINLIEKRILGKLIIESIESRVSENSERVCNAIKELFEDLNKGSKENQIFGFNGGLFKQEISREIYFKDLREKEFFNDCKQKYKFKEEDIKISKEERNIFEENNDKINPIIRNILFIASYDFRTDVNVNILGHIFEQSISDLEELKGKRESKRKKEGVFYTPEYITEYICKNTIIPHLSKKKNNEVSELIKEYKDNIKELEERVKQIKILDPACGSGAFLIKATEILLEIFKGIHEVRDLQKEYNAQRGLKIKSNIQGQTTLKKWDDKDETKRIIENNIFGVDINEESVEITKLSLFLKLVKRNKKLPVLSSNIKHGNSLIDDEETAGRLAFDWDKEFPFKFDVVIGNPPYVRQERFTEIKPYLEKKYEVYSGVADLYTYFYEKGLSLLKQDGCLGFISSNKWMRVKYGKNLRELLKQKSIIRLIDFFELKVFEDASTEPIIVILENKIKQDRDIKVTLVNNLAFNNFESYIKTNTHRINQQELDNAGWNLSPSKNKGIIKKIKENSITLGNFVSKRIYSGIKTGANHIFVINEEKFKELTKKDKYAVEIINPLIDGVRIDNYNYELTGLYLIVAKKRVNIEKYPSIKEYLSQYKSELSKRSDIVGKGKWFELRRCAYYNEFEKDKIVYIHTARKHKFALDSSRNNYVINNCYFINSSSKYLLAYLNSNLFEYYKINTFVSFGDAMNKGRCKLDYNKMINIPIKKIDRNTESEFEQRVNDIINLKESFYSKRNRFLNKIKVEYKINKLSNKIKNFFELNFEDLINEIKTYSQKEINIFNRSIERIEDYFDKNKKDILSLRKEIDKREKEINEMIYKLYGITEQEKEIIEKS